MIESAHARGIYHAKCYRPDGTLRWEAIADNIVTTVGKDLALDAYLSGAPYSVVGPFMGLISSVGFTAVAATDTMSSHPDWREAGIANAPTYAPTRATVIFSAASAGAKTSVPAAVFGITSVGTLKGAFLVYGPGATNVIADTGGTLYSAGLFTGGDEPVNNGDTLNVTYTASL